MSLFGNLLTTYEMIQGASGQTPHSAEKDGDADAAKRALIPYGHTTLPVSLTVLVDANGCIRGVAKRKSTIIIPCTEESMGRTIKPVPHPLFDQLQYVDSERSPEKTSMYLQQLAKWKGDDAKLEAVFKCVSEHSISEAAAHYGMELTDKDDKVGVCFEVQIGLEDSDLSNDVDIRNRWIAYLQRSQHKLGKDIFGEDLYTPTTNFPKKVVSSDANAKLLSANDSTNFSFAKTKNRDWKPGDGTKTLEHHTDRPEPARDQARPADHREDDADPQRDTRRFRPTRSPTPPSTSAPESGRRTGPATTNASLPPRPAGSS